MPIYKTIDIINDDENEPVLQLLHDLKEDRVSIAILTDQETAIATVSKEDFQGLIKSLEEIYYSIPDFEKQSSEDFIEDQFKMYRDEILNLRADLEKARSTNILKIESVNSQKYDDLKTAYNSLKEENENLVMSLNSAKVECGNHLNKIHHLEKENESLKEDNRISKNRFSHNVGVYDTLVENHAILANCNAKYKGQINYLKNKVSSLQGQLKYHLNLLEKQDLNQMAKNQVDVQESIVFNNGNESLVFNPKEWVQVSEEKDLPVNSSGRFNLVTIIRGSEVLTKDHSHEALVKNFHSGSLKYWQHDV